MSFTDPSVVVGDLGLSIGVEMPLNGLDRVLQFRLVRLARLVGLLLVSFRAMHLRDVVLVAMLIHNMHGFFAFLVPSFCVV